MVKHQRYIAFRPKVSDKGARIRGPIPSITTKPVWQLMTAVCVTFRDFAICLTPGVNMLLAKGERIAMRPMMAMLLNFLHFDQFRGWSESSFENSMS